MRRVGHFEPSIRALLQTGAQMLVHSENVGADPIVRQGVQFAHQLEVEAGGIRPCLELINGTPKASVIGAVLRCGRAAMTRHAGLLVRKMDVNVDLQILHQLKKKLEFTLGGIARVQLQLEAVDFFNESPMLNVNFRIPNFVCLTPNNHGVKCSSACVL